MVEAIQISEPKTWCKLSLLSITLTFLVTFHSQKMLSSFITDYSEHRTRLREDDGDEKDGYDETLVPIAVNCAVHRDSSDNL